MKTKQHKVHDMAKEYRFDYSKAKPNRFAEKMNLNVGWTVERFVAEEKKEKAVAKAKKSSAKTKKKVPAKKPTTKSKIKKIKSKKK